MDCRARWKKRSDLDENKKEDRAKDNQRNHAIEDEIENIKAKGIASY